MLEGEHKRLRQLKEMLAARTDSAGKPKPGYKGNVEQLRVHIAELEKRLPAQKQNLRNA